MADRIEREIEEILRKIDDFVPDRSRKRPNRRPPRPANQGPGWLARRLSAISLNRVMMWALVVFLFAFFLRGTPFGGWLMVGSLIVLATALAISVFGGGRRPTAQKRWRGEPLDLSGPSWPDRIKAWLKGRKRT